MDRDCCGRFVVGGPVSRKSLTVRLTLLALFVAAGSVTAYLFWQGESRAEKRSARLGVDGGTPPDVDLDMRAAQQACRGRPGEPFWMAKVVAALPGCATRVSPAPRPPPRPRPHSTRPRRRFRTSSDGPQGARLRPCAAARVHPVFGNGPEQTAAIVERRRGADGRGDRGARRTGAAAAAVGAAAPRLSCPRSEAQS